MRPAHAAIEPVLHRHLHGDLDRDRAGIGKEHAVEIAGQQRRQPPRQRQRLLVHQPAEHHMRHRRELALDRRADVRMIIAVAGGPPRGDAVDQFAPVGEHDAAALGARDRQRRPRRLHLRIGQPDVVEAGRVPAGRRVAFLLVLPAFGASMHRDGASIMPFGDCRSLDDSLDDSRKTSSPRSSAPSLRRSLVETDAGTASGPCATADGCCHSPATIIST